VSDQHPVTHSVTIQITEASDSRQCEREICSLSIDNQMLLAELLDAQVRAIDAMRRRLPAAGVTFDCRLCRLTSSEIQRFRDSAALQQQLQRILDSSDDEDKCSPLAAAESVERLGELKRSLQSDNDALRHVLSALNELEDSNLLQQHGDINHHGGDINSLNSTYFHQEMSRLQQRMLVKLYCSQSC